MPSTRERGQPLLELIDLGAQDELAVVEHPLYAKVDSTLEFLVLRFQIHECNTHCPRSRLANTAHIIVSPARHCGTAPERLVAKRSFHSSNFAIAATRSSSDIGGFFLGRSVGIVEKARARPIVPNTFRSAVSWAT